MDTKIKLKLKRFVNHLDSIRGRHTELVSVYIPAKYDMHKIISHLAQEQGTATNIKDKQTRNNVINSLEKMIRHLRVIGRTPKNGLAIFAGNTSKKEGQPDIEVFSVEPPEALNIRTYRCDQSFLTEHLKQFMEYKEVYGLIVIDRREGNIGLLKGTNISELAGFTSNVPGKTTKGGQCIDSQSLVELSDGEKIKVEDIKIGDKVKSYNFDKEVFQDSEILDKWEVMKEEFYVINNNLKCSKDHLIFLRDGSTKAAEKLIKGDSLLNEKGEEIKIENIEKISEKIRMIDISVENRSFIANCVLVHNSQQRYARLRDIAAAEFFKRVGDAANKEFLEMKNLKGILVGGPGPTKEDFLRKDFLNNNLKLKVIAVKDLGYTGSFGLDELVDKSQDVLANEVIIEEKKIMQEFFTKLSTESDKVSYGKDEVKKALEMGAVKILLLSETVDDKTISEFEKLADASGSEIKMISVETREGTQLKDMGEIAAILRFPVY